MTTTVTVETNDHAARVTIREVSQGQEGHNVNDRDERVEPKGRAQFYVHDNVQLLIVEERIDAEAAEFLKTGGSARPITDEDIAKTNHQPG